jgi:hypothetical protein
MLVEERIADFQELVGARVATSPASPLTTTALSPASDLRRARAVAVDGKATGDAVDLMDRHAAAMARGSSGKLSGTWVVLADGSIVAMTIFRVAIIAEPDLISVRAGRSRAGY